MWTRLRVMASRALGFCRASREDREFEDEVASHLAMLEEDNVRRGMTPDEARSDARRNFGGVTQVRELRREASGMPRIEAILQDVRYGLRMLRRNPGFTAVAVVTLGLGIGLNTTVFTVYDSVALRPLAVKDPATLMRLKRWYGPHERSERFTWNEYLHVRDRAQSFSDVGATTEAIRIPARLAAGGAREFVRARFVSPNYFAMLGVDAPATGVVLSHRFWLRRFQSDPAIRGKLILLNGASFPVTGVAPESFAGTGAPPAVPDLWLSYDMHAQAGVPPHPLQILGRRKPGIAVRQVESEMAGIEKQLESIEPPGPRKVLSLSAEPATFFDHASGDFEVFQWIAGVLMCAVSAILLIACVNLVNLLLARAMARENEISVRCALGAGRMRLVQQLCIESALLGLAGGAAGLVLSIGVCRFLTLLLASTLSRLGIGAEYLFLDLQPSASVFLFTLAVSLAAGILVGLAPARQATRARVAATPRAWARNALIAAQFALCLTLLVGAGLLGKGVLAARAVDSGFETKQVFAILFTGDAIQKTPAERSALLAQLVERFEAVPQVRAVSLAQQTPLMGHSTAPFRPIASRIPPDSANARSLYNRVSPRYFEVLGIPILRGRTFTQQEADQNAPVAVISEATARRYWPGEDALGKSIGTLRIEGLNERAFTVIGVVKSVRSTNLSRIDPAYIYFPGSYAHAWSILVRGSASESVLVPLLRDAAMGVDRTLGLQMTVLNLETGPAQLQHLMTKAPATVAAVLGALGLLLAAVGIHGVVAYLVSRRTREIGVRIALGAGRSDVLKLVFGQAWKPLMWGLPLGLAGSGALSIILGKAVLGIENPDLLFGANPWSPAAFLGVLLFLGAVVWAASWLPARRAMRIDPALALRYE